jgi:hypothetical protein
MKRKMLNEDEVMNVVLAIPKEAVKIKMKCKLMDGRKTLAKFGVNEILESRKMYIELDPYGDAFDTYTLTDLGREQIKDDRGVY